MTYRYMGLVDTRIDNDPNIASVDSTTSATVVLLSVNCTGAQDFTLANRGSINVYITGSFNAGGMFISSVAMTNVADNASTNAVSASTACRFTGPYQVVRVVANSGSGVYRPTLIYR